METRARYLLIGLFALTVIAAGFGFVYWLNSTGTLGKRAVYRIRFENSVAGLLAGSGVLFNGIRVGEVTDLALNPDHPQEVLVTIAIDPRTPLRRDTFVGLDAQGLLGGSSTISLLGRSSNAPLVQASGQEPPEIVADSTATGGVGQVARETLARLDRLLADNADGVHTTVTNLSTFSAALARNSDRLDGIIAGLERLTGAAPEKPPAPAVYLTAPTDFPGAVSSPHGQLVIPEPTAVIAFDTQKILLRSAAGQVAAKGDVHWSDNLPKLVQATLVQTFENAHFLQAIARPFEGLVADNQLLVDIRRFEVSVADENEANVEFAARILGRDGRIEQARLFHASAPAKSIDAAAAAAALNAAFGVAARELVLWAAPLI